MLYNAKGGNVLASGGFGCIFDPPIKCQNTYYNTDPNNLSKLMIKKNAESEFRHIQSFKSLLQSVPNYSRYFLLDNFTICQPDKLTNTDLSNFQKCKALTKRGYNKKNINNSLEDLLVINMPNGGINVEEFVGKYFTKNNIIHLNNSLIDLLQNGIIPMNALKVYHCDIKDSNVLVDSSFETRLIDWGLSVHKPEELFNEVPKGLYRRPFQFNVPFSVILFNGEFIKLYDDFLLRNKDPNYYDIREFVVNYIFVWNEIRGAGHLEAINDIIKQFSEGELVAINKQNVKDHMIEYDFTYYYIVEYITKIIKKYTVHGKLELFNYFNNIFIKNVDIWGFVMIYICIYEKIYSSNIAEDFKPVTQQIKYIIQDFLFSNPTQLINISLLIEELTKLNNIINSVDVSILEESGGAIKIRKKQTNKNKSRKINKRKHSKISKRTKTRMRK